MNYLNYMNGVRMGAQDTNNVGSNFNSNNQQNSDYVREIEEFTERVLKGSDKIDEQSYHSMKGMFMKIIRTQNGSRMLQKSIKKTSKEILSFILEELIDEPYELIIDPYANYFCQKFFAVLKSSDRLRFLQRVSPFIGDVSKSKIGTYPIQAFIEQLSNMDEKIIVIKATKDNIMELCFVI